MTQPDGYTPDKPSVNFYGLAALAGKTAEDWQRDLFNDNKSHFLDLETGMYNILKMLADLWGKFVDVIGGVLPPEVEHTFDEFIRWLNDLWDNVTQIVDDFNKLIRDLTHLDIHATVEDLIKFFQDIVTLLGNPFGLGTGFVHLPYILTEIPIVRDTVMYFNSLIAQIPVVGTGLLSLNPPNLMMNGSFDTADSIPSTGGWSWDHTITHSGLGGSAKVVADGTLKTMLSNPVKVEKDDVLDVTVWVAWQGLTAPQNSLPIGVYLNLYDKTGALLPSSPHLMKGLEQPWPATDMVWTELFENWQVPDGVAEVALRLQVSASATAGTVWFDDAKLMKPNLMPQGMIDGFQDFIDNVTGEINASFNELEDFILNKRLATEQFQSMLDGFAGQAQSSIEAFLNALHSGDKITHGSVLDDVVPGIGTIVDNVVQAVQGLIGSGFTHQDSLNAMGQQSNSVTQAAAQTVQHAAQITDLFDTTGNLFGQTNGLISLVTGHASAITSLVDAVNLLRVGTAPPPVTNPGGSVPGSNPGSNVTSASDSFERSGSTLGSGWYQVYSSGSNGTLGTDGHNAAWVPVYPNGNRECAAVWTGASPVSLTDFQTVSVVLGSASEFDALGYKGAVDVLGRCASNLGSFVRFRVDAKGYWGVSAVISGSETMFFTGQITGPPGAGSTLTLICGDKAGNQPRKFTAIMNGLYLVNNQAEPGTTSIYGTNARGGGFGGLAQGALFTPGVNRPGSVNQWQMQDTA